MSTSLRHTPPSSPPPEASNKRARIAVDSPSVDTSKPAEDITAASTAATTPKSEAKKETKRKGGKRAAKSEIDPVLLVDILASLGWDSLPDSQSPASDAETLGSRLWPKQGPPKSHYHRKPGSECVEIAPPEWKFTDAEFKVVNLTSHGDGIAVYPPKEEGPAAWAIIIPFTLPGDVVKARVTRNLHYHSFAEPLSLPSTSHYEPPTTSDKSIFPLPLTRDPSLPQCKYFTTCGGCQYQSLSYDQQLAIKRLVLQKAMRNFSNLKEGIDWPEVGTTIPSPKQYGYRTKITPHFELPKVLQTGRKGRRAVSPTKPAQETVVDEEETENAPSAVERKPEYNFPIGFNEACRNRIIDIEECPIATPVINAHLPIVREEVKLNIKDFKRGATLLFRDSLMVKDQKEVTKADKGKAIAEVVKDDVLDERICVTSHHQTITEKVGDIIFQFPAGSFFQNNSSILVPLTSYVKTQLEELGVARRSDGDETYLVDAYCGSGLFSLTLASSFTRVLGIEIDPQSITYATHNALTNNITNASFLPGASESIFESAITTLEGKGDQTTLIVDPPRKGCDEVFLRQVVVFRPRVVVYVSCNVHTMAADISLLLRLTSSSLTAEGKDPNLHGYKIKSIRAIDLFPQTHHAEGLCVLMRD